jgi:hypothetical protein
VGTGKETGMSHRIKRCCAYCVYLRKSELGAPFIAHCDARVQRVIVQVNAALYWEVNCQEFVAKTLEEVTADTLSGKWYK